MLGEELIMEMVGRRVERLKDRKGVILDGLGGSMGEGEGLKKMVGEGGERVKVMVEVEVGEEEVMKGVMKGGEE